jgi:holo-[acyl-carrier protein] synthase
MKSIGVDTVAIKKFESVITSSGDGFIEHVFSSAERKYCASAANTVQSFAGHYAAKEALAKAMPSLRSYGVDWKDIEVTHNNFGAPQFVMNDALCENLGRMSGSTILLSISHTSETAVAMVAIV